MSCGVYVQDGWTASVEKRHKLVYGQDFVSESCPSSQTRTLGSLWGSRPDTVLVCVLYQAVNIG